MKLRNVQGIVAAGFLSSALLFGCNQEAIDSTAETLAPLLGTQNPDAVEGQYIVVFKDGTSTKIISSAKEHVATFKASAVQHSYTVIPGFSAKLSWDAVESLRTNPDVAYIEQDAYVSLGANANGQDRVDQREGRDGAAYNNYGRNGSGVHAYIIDTGIDTDHSEYAGRVGNGTDTVDNDSNPEDCHGHGTHVAGTVAGTKYGLASGATVHGVRVLNCQGSGTNAGVVAGVDWVRNNHIKPAVANMSLGGSASTATDNAVNNAVAAGVTFAVAAGNENTDACTKSPARAANAITVGSVEDTSDARSSFSNYGSCVDIWAPGRNIKSAWLNNGTNTISGTSMATPHVAGAAAQYLGANPSATPAQVQAALEGVANVNCVTGTNGAPNVLLFNDFGAGATHDCGGGGGGPGNPNSCFENAACGGQAPGGCWCDSWCTWSGDCCADGPC